MSVLEAQHSLQGLKGQMNPSGQFNLNDKVDTVQYQCVCVCVWAVLSGFMCAGIMMCESDGAYDHC